LGNGKLTIRVLRRAILGHHPVILAGAATNQRFPGNRQEITPAATVIDMDSHQINASWNSQQINLLVLGKCFLVCG